MFQLGHGELRNRNSTVVQYGLNLAHEETMKAVTEPNNVCQNCRILHVLSLFHNDKLISW